MKKVTLIAVAILFASFANAQEAKHDAQPATAAPAVVKDITKTLEFKNDSYDFGKIPFGKQAEYDLFFKNISKDTVILDRVQVGCGCTTPKYQQGQKVAPNETAKVTLGFNGSTDGAFTKYVTIFFNDGMQKAVNFKGETYKTPDTAAPANSGVEKMKGAK